MGSGAAAAWVETPLALVLAVCASVSDLRGWLNFAICLVVEIWCAAAEYLAHRPLPAPVLFSSQSAWVPSRCQSAEVLSAVHP